MPRRRPNPEHREAAAPGDPRREAPPSDTARREAPREQPGGPPEPDFDKLDGVITAVVQDAQTLEVRMVAFMNREAWQQTLETGYAHFYSRSRGRLWKKGESSGNVQAVQEIRVDCDQDAVVLRVEQVGELSCHTGNRSCFYRRLENGRLNRVEGE
ncbi:MAG: phosphoribosyl-AMP cyclohydrolase [Spirochaetota bacterium]